MTSDTGSFNADAENCPEADAGENFIRAVRWLLRIALDHSCFDRTLVYAAGSQELKAQLSLSGVDGGLLQSSCGECD
jgi:hypothetical protein